MVKQQHHQQEDRPTGKDEWHEVNGVKFRYEAEETGGGGSGGSGSSPNTLQLAVPVFYATEQDVRCDFEKFIVKIESVLEKYGVGKVVPPKSWAPAAPKVEGSSSLAAVRAKREEKGREGRQIQTQNQTQSAIASGSATSTSGSEEVKKVLRGKAESLVIPKAIKQHATGRKGIFRTYLVEQKPMEVGSQYRPFAEQKDKQPPLARSNGSVNHDPQGSFDLEAIERHFWKNVTYQPPIYGADIEGSLFDEIGEEGNPAQKWNIRKLDTILSKVLEAFIEEKEKEKRMKKEAKREASKQEAEHTYSMRKRRKTGAAKKEKEEKKVTTIPGVISPYLYFGMYRSFFAWHTEDVDLYSVNYLHFGAPKVWYTVPPKHRKRFESSMRSSVPDLFMHCDQFLRHKELLASPMVIRAENIPLVKFVQRENEWVINYPGAYHAGFNCGFNCAESTNFATSKWIQIGKEAKCCECSKDSVRLDMDLFERFQKKCQPMEERDNDGNHSKSDTAGLSTSSPPVVAPLPA